MKNDRLVTAVIGTAHGLDGSVKIRSFSGEYRHIAAERQFQTKREDQWRLLTVERIRVTGKAAIVKFREVHNRDEAELLKGQELWVGRSDASIRSDNEYYYADLVGLDVVVGTDTIGQVRSVVEGPQGEFLEIGLQERVVLVPFHSAYVGPVDLKGNIVEIVAPWVLD